jgi:tRNA(adenine34) deaminase
MNIYNDSIFMEHAYKQAKKAVKIDEVPVGCVIVNNGKIIAKTHNLKEKKQNSILHAEMVAIEIASKKLRRWRLSDCDIYVTLEPCVMCMGAILSARFNRLIFGALDPKAGACGSVYDLNEGLLNHQVLITNNVMNKECSAILTDYFKGKREAKRNAKN